MVVALRALTGEPDLARRFGFITETTRPGHQSPGRVAIFRSRNPAPLANGAARHLPVHLAGEPLAEAGRSG